MSTILAFDTSTSRTSVGIFEDGVLVWSGYRDGATARNRSARVVAVANARAAVG